VNTKVLLLGLAVVPPSSRLGANASDTAEIIGGVGAFVQLMMNTAYFGLHRR